MLRISVVLLVAVSPILAADLDVTIKPVYFQTIHSSVLVDRRGTPWFCVKERVHDATGKRIASGPTENHRLILVDKVGRFWFRHHWQGGSAPLVFNDGKQQVETKLIMLAIHEDLDGRVFVRTPKAIHVLSPEGQWAEKKLFEADNIGSTVFAEDDQGRTWMWVIRNQPNLQGGNEGTVGVWCFDRKEWKQHSPATGFPFEHVEHLLPFADDWFVVIEHIDQGRYPPPPTAKVWSPSRGPKTIAAAKVFANLPTIAIRYFGTDLDGNRYLYRQYAAHDGAKQHEATWVRVSQRGEVEKLDVEKRGKGKIGQSVLFLQPRVEKDPMLPILAKPDDVRAVFPDTGSYDCLGRDKEGRIFFREHYGSGTHVLWPAKEQPGEILRLERFNSAPIMRGYVRGTDGTVWSVNEAVDRWDGKQWVETPIQPIKLAGWQYRHAPPPEYHYANYQNLSAMPTASGGLVVSRVTTKYAGTQVNAFVDQKDPIPVNPKAAFYKFETRFYTDGKWGDAGDSLMQFQASAKELIRTLNVFPAERHAVAACSDGKRLWVAFNGLLHAIDANGKSISVELPKRAEIDQAKKGGWQGDLPTLTASTLFPVGDGKLLVVRDSEAQLATIQDEKKSISLEVIKGGTPTTLFKDREGVVWGWTRPNKLVQFNGKEFILNKDVGVPVGITDDGVLWCREAIPAKHPPLVTRPITYYRVCGKSIEKHEWKHEEVVSGFTKVPKGAAIIWATQHTIVCVDPQNKPGERPTMRKQTFADNLGTSGVGPPFEVTGTGEILFCSHWGRLFSK